MCCNNNLLTFETLLKLIIFLLVRQLNLIYIGVHIYIYILLNTYREIFFIIFLFLFFNFEEKVDTSAKYSRMKIDFWLGILLQIIGFKISIEIKS